MKYAIVTTSNSRRAGGVCEAVAGMTNAFLKFSNDICLVSYNDEYSDEDLKLYGGLTHYNYNVSNFPLLSSFAYSSELVTLLESIIPDVIDVQGVWQYNSYASHRFIKKHPKSKIVVTPHGMLDPWAIKNSAWKKKILGWLFKYKNLREADCIKALCKSEYESIRAFGLKIPVAIIPNGINLPKNIIYDRIHEKKILLFIGRIHPKKGLRELIEGLAIVKSTEPELIAKWNVRIAGWDQNGHTEELITLTKERGLTDTVEFIGSVFRKDKERELCKANAFALTSFSEGLPMSVLEAWAYELPVLMTDYCNLPEGFEANAAIRVGTNYESIAEGLKTLFQMEDDRLIRIGRNGKKLVKQRFTWNKVAEQTLELYQWLLLGGNVPEFVRLK